jgi:hypothetical protein
MPETIALMRRSNEKIITRLLSRTDDAVITGAGLPPSGYNFF